MLCSLVIGDKSDNELIMAPGLTPAPADTETQLGYWSPRTATIDWCEDNYQVRKREPTCTTEITANNAICHLGL